MTMTMCFTLLLLICALSTAQIQTESGNEIFPLGRQSEQPTTEPAHDPRHQQTCTQDINAVLIEMSALVAEQRVEMRVLQRETEVQAAKLRELELYKTEMDKLKQQLEVKRVAFSASLLASGSGTTGPFNTATPLVFRRVVTNIGNAYNPHTGFFIAPVKGVYHFEMHVGAHGHASHPSGAELLKNGEKIFIAYEHQPSHFGEASNGATLLLEVGDVVYLSLWPNSNIFDNENHHSTFSGHLLFTT